MMRKLKIPCDMCAGSLRRGLLWLSGNDYLECPQCGGTGTVACVEQRVQARVRTVFMAGQKPHVEVALPKRNSISGGLIHGR